MQLITLLARCVSFVAGFVTYLLKAICPNAQQKEQQLHEILDLAESLALGTKTQRVVSLCKLAVVL